MERCPGHGRPHRPLLPTHCQPTHLGTASLYSRYSGVALPYPTCLSRCSSRWGSVSFGAAPASAAAAPASAAGWHKFELIPTHQQVRKLGSPPSAQLALLQLCLFSLQLCLLAPTLFVLESGPLKRTVPCGPTRRLPGTPPPAPPPVRPLSQLDRTCCSCCGCPRYVWPALFHRGRWVGRKLIRNSR